MSYQAVTCTHCGGRFFPEAGASCDDCPRCGRTWLAPKPVPVCKCDFRTRLVGDGCEVCNPELAAEMADPLPGEVYHAVREVDYRMGKHMPGEGTVTKEDWAVIKSALSGIQAQLAAKGAECEELREENILAIKEMAKARGVAAECESDGLLLHEVMEGTPGLLPKVWKRAIAAESSRDGYKARCEALEKALAGEKAAREHDRSVRFAFPKELQDGCPDDIRSLGWAVAVHNDYRLNGVKHTFWLFTKGDRNVKGEGLTDAEALNEARAALAATEATA